MISGALQAMAEANALLQVYGVDAERFLSIMMETLFGTFIYKAYGPMIADSPPEVPSGLALPMTGGLIAIGRQPWQPWLGGRFKRQGLLLTG